MSKAVRRSRKLNSDNENFFIYDEGEVANIGPVPYESVYDYSKNGASHLVDTLYYDDGNFFQRRSFETSEIKHPYKI